MRSSGLVLAAGLALGADMASAEGLREVVFQCDGKAITVGFAEGAATLRIRDVTVLLDAQPVASGIHYLGGGHDLRGKGSELVWSEPGGNIRMCHEQAAEAGDGAAGADALADTSWSLVHFQSSDDAIGAVVPPRVDRYSLRFGDDGSAALRLDCNRSTATWEAQPTSATDGGLSFGPAALTRAACGEGAMDVRLAQDLGRIRSYTLADGMLNLALEADGGIYVWKPEDR